MIFFLNVYVSKPKNKDNSNLTWFYKNVKSTKTVSSASYSRNDQYRHSSSLVSAYAINFRLAKGKIKVSVLGESPCICYHTRAVDAMREHISLCGLAM